MLVAVPHPASAGAGSSVGGADRVRRPAGPWADRYSWTSRTAVAPGVLCGSTIQSRTGRACDRCGAPCSAQPIAVVGCGTSRGHGAPVAIGAMSVIMAEVCGICAASGAGVLGRATFNPLVQGSTRWRPTCWFSRLTWTYVQAGRSWPWWLQAPTVWKSWPMRKPMPAAPSPMTSICSPFFRQSPTKVTAW